MRVLVCGSRTWTDRACIRSVLNGLYGEAPGPLVLIEGGQHGADRIASEWADEWVPYVLTHLRFPADWQTYGKKAGPIRNAQMLEEGSPDVVWAFVNRPLAESRGTANMVRRAVAAGIPTYVVQAM